MSLPEDYLSYPNRREGNDHEWFDFSALPGRPPVTWPRAEPVALFVTVAFESYPLSGARPPVTAPNAIAMGTPGHLQSTTIDYGLRVGVFRLFEALDAHGVTATALVNSDVARRYPRLIEEIVGRGWEVVASGIDMSRPITGAMPLEEERALIKESLSTLRGASGQPVVGWHSPAYSESRHTLDVLAEEGIEYVTDWVNDDMPYRMRTAAGTLHALPLNNEWADANIVGGQRQPTQEIYRQGIAAYRALRAEAKKTGGGRILCLPLHPSVSGQPFRIWTVEKLLAEITDGGCWSATGSQILSEFRGQAPVP